jgi:hypothetical protein
MNAFRKLTVAASALCLAAALLTVGSVAYAKTGDEIMSTPFKGPKANTGSVSYSQEGAKRYLTLSTDFKVPDTPDPHWQVIDSKGEAHLLQALKVKPGESNMKIELPKHVPDVARVVIWCAFAQVNLGEASFAKPLK